MDTTAWKLKKGEKREDPPEKDALPILPTRLYTKVLEDNKKEDKAKEAKEAIKVIEKVREKKKEEK